MARPLKPLHWIASSLDDLRQLPEDVKDEFGYALQRAQEGARAPRAKPLQGFGGANVLEIVEDHDGATYRAVYTVRFALAIYVLHVFQKKSKRGVATPQADLSLIKSRLRTAAEEYERQYGGNSP
ncbi:MAG TPA: type II toxin-antitoxin system RelE/ParE family toxin [Armatimonadota bacterium]|nr:type II toxin-antitoxin system RelE/ParE family toxin [Armatimonadota bacterium]